LTSPRVVHLGVTGHRSFADAEGVADRLRVALDKLRGLASDKAGHAPVRLEILSALAEGADRLVAKVALSHPDDTLVAVLPLAREEYLEDFTSAESRSEFEDLLAASRLIETMPPAPTREAAYELAGHWIVDHSDTLVALWDRDPARGRGGTAEIVTYAVACGVPVLWVRTERPREGGSWREYLDERE